MPDTTPPTPPLPPGAVLVHVGPPKTGTTAIQSSLERHRDDLLAHDVRYPGEDLRHRDAARELRDNRPPGTHRPPSGSWDAVVAEVRASPSDRVVVSAEELAGATPEQARRLVDDLGPDRVHVLIAVRRLDLLLPSAWQQQVRNDVLEQYEPWLARVLDGAESGRAEPGDGVAHVVGAWADLLPPDRLVLMVRDEDDPTQLMRAFEDLLGLPTGLLTPGGWQNSSFSYQRVELWRRVSVLARERGWDDRRRRSILYHGLLAGLQAAPTHPAEQPAPTMPAWAWPRVVATSDARVSEVLAARSSGARVLGDPEQLRVVASDVPVDPSPPETISTDVVAHAVATLYERVVLREDRFAASARRRRRGSANRRLVDASTGALLGELVRRPVRRLRASLRRGDGG